MFTLYIIGYGLLCTSFGFLVAFLCIRPRAPWDHLDTPHQTTYEEKEDFDFILRFSKCLINMDEIVLVRFVKEDTIWFYSSLGNLIEQFEIKRDPEDFKIAMDFINRF